MSRATVRGLLRLAVTTLVATMSLATPPAAWATERCGASDGHTLCVTVPDTDLTGEVAIGVTNTPNDGTVLATWVPSGKGTVPIPLITRTTPSPPANEYSFVWPTQKYLDASGVLRLQHTSATGPGSPVEVAVTLSNGNVDDFQHTPADWESFLPGPWNAPSDPVVAAVGDGPSARPAAHALAESIANADPDLFLFLGDIYEQGTFTENLNHYGRNAMDGGPGTLWGRLGRITQPTIGNHEADANVADWVDYFHGRPLYTSFRMGNVLFFDLATSETGMSPGSSQYEYVESVLTSPSNPPPPCIVAYMHKPPLSLDSINPERAEMWKLLMDHGGDLVLTGHVHSMIEYKPLNRDLQLPSPRDPTMVQIVNGAGYGEGNAYLGDVRVDWSKGKTPVATYLTLNGAANGGTPTSISWEHRATDGTVLHTGTRDCAGEIAPLNEPVFDQDLPDRTDEEEQAVDLSAGATDPNGDALTYEATGLPPGVSIDPVTGRISGTIAPGAVSGSPYAVEVTVGDGTAPSPPEIRQLQRESGHQNLTTSTSLTFDHPPSEGNLLVGIGEYNGDRDPTIPAGWSLALDTNTNPETVIFYRVAGPGETPTVPLSVSGDPTRISMAIFEYSGLDANQAGVLDRVVADTAVDATSVSTGTATTSDDRELLLASVGTGANRIFQNAWTNGFQQQTDGARHTVAHRIVTEIGDYETSESWDPPSRAVGALVGFKGGDAREVTDAFTWTVVPRSACPGGRKPQALTFRNDGATGLFRVTDKSNPYDRGGKRFFAGEVPAGTEFTAFSKRAGDDRFPGTLWIHRYADDGTGIESISLKADCSQPLDIGQSFGDFRLVDFIAEKEPVDPYTPPWTGPVAAPSPKIGGKNVDLDLLNFAEARELQRIEVTWPVDPNKKLAKVKLNGATLFDAKADGGSAVITAFKGNLADRTLGAGAVGQLRLEFESDAAPDPFAYTLNLTFTDGTTAAFPGPNSPPVVDVVTIDQATPRTHDTLTSTVNAHDADGHPLSYSYQWSRNGADLAGETRATLDLSVAGNGDRGDQIAVRVIASDGRAESAPVTAAPVTVVDAGPAFDQDLADRTDAEGDVVALSAGATDPDGDPLTYDADGLPPGVSIDPDTGEISGAIAPGAVAGSPYPVEVTVRDGAVPPAPEITQVQRKSGHENTVTSTSLSFDTSPKRGHLLVGVGVYNGDRVATIPAGWSLALETGTNPEAVVFYRVAGTGEPSSVPLSVSGGATRISMAIFEYSGLNRNQANVLDRVASNSVADGTSVSTGTTATTSHPDELLLAVVGTGGNRIFQNTWTNGFLQQTDGARHTVAHRVVTELGAFETTESWDASAGAVGALVGFKAGEPPDAADTFRWTVVVPSPCRDGRKPQALTFRNNGDSGLIRVTDKSNPLDAGGKRFFAGEVPAGTEFTAYSKRAGDDRFPGTLWIHRYADDGTGIESISLKADCSQPLDIGQSFGDFRLVDFIAEKEPVDPYSPPWTGPVAAAEPTIGGKNLDMDLLNFAEDRELQRIEVTWPVDPNKKLAKVKLNGATLFDAKADGGSAVITVFKGNLADRTLAPGAVGQLRLEFESDAAVDLTAYTLHLTFTDGTTAGFPS